MSSRTQQFMVLGGSRLEHRAFPSGVTHNFYIYGPVTEHISDYVDMITVMDTSEEHDTINLYINTPGGSVETTISIVHAMLRSKAHIVCHADGQVASAGTLIFFAGKSFVVQPFAHAMFHDGSTIIGGKFSENLKSAQATSELINKICMELYVPYFSEEEVQEILKGDDQYLSSEDLYDRVTKGVEILQEQIEQELQAINEVVEEVDEEDEEEPEEKPKKKRGRPPKKK